jgi:inner membrane protein
VLDLDQHSLPIDFEPFRLSSGTFYPLFSGCKAGIMTRRTYVRVRFLFFICHSRQSSEEFMKGSTHLAIGTAVGLAAAAYYPFTPQNAAYYVTVAAFSALSADLDGPSILSAKLGKASKMLRTAVLWAGLGMSAVAAFQYFSAGVYNKEFTAAAVMVLLLGFVSKQGAIRNALVSLIGCALAYTGWVYAMNWLIGFGLFVAWAPWLKHRGMTHTVWAILLWGAIGWGLEKQLRIEGITAVAMYGYFSHLLADTLTPSGVKWFYPLYRKSIKFPF